MVLVSPELTSTERQRVAFEAAEQEASTREPAHIVGAHDDAREIPDRIRNASFEPEYVPFRGPAGMFPPEIPEDADHRGPAIDGNPGPIADLPQDRLGRLLTRDGVKAIDALPPNQRLVLTLRDIEGCSTEEVCNALGIRETNGRVLLHRARARVRAALEPYMGGE